MPSTADSLPILATLRRTLHLARHSAGGWGRLLLAPYLLQIVLLALVQLALPDSLAVELAVQATGLLYVPAATAWIRGIQAGASAAHETYRWGRNELRYLARYIALMLAVGLLGLIAAFLVLLATGGHPAEALAASIALIPVLIAAMGLLLWLLAPVLMVLPAAAAGQEASLGASLRLTHGNRWRVVAVGYLTSLVLLGCFAVLVAILWVMQVVVILLVVTPSASATTLDIGLLTLTLATTTLAQATAAALSTLLHASALGCVYQQLKLANPRAQPWIDRTVAGRERSVG